MAFPYYKRVHQIKLFKGIESETAQLEKQINSWLAAEGVRVISMTGNIAPQSPPPDEKLAGLGASPWAPSDVLIVIHYEK